MNVSKGIKNEPYLKVSNLCDLEDIETAFKYLKDIEEKHGESLTICKKYLQIVEKESELKAKGK